jgi:hypothetical protein
MIATTNYTPEYIGNRLPEYSGVFTLNKAPTDVLGATLPVIGCHHPKRGVDNVPRATHKKPRFPI